MIEVHHLEQSRSHRVLWLLEELGLEYEIIVYKRLPSLLAPPELKAIHPLGKSPVIRDGAATIAESGAILEYIVDRYGEGRLVPPRDSEEEFLRYRYFMHYAEGSLMPPLLVALVVKKLGPLGWPARGVVKGWIKTHLDFLEGELEKRPYFTGDAFSVADIQMSFPLLAAKRSGLDARYPRLLDLLKRLMERPALARAIEKGGPFEAPV